MAAAADKPKPYFPLAGGANDGWSKEDEATATCFCGAVQLAFVSSSQSCPILRPALSGIPLLRYLLILIPSSAYSGSWSREHFCLQLLGLPQNHGFHVCEQFHRRRQVPQAPTWSRQPENLRTVTYHRFWRTDDQLLLFDLRDAHVPRRRGVSRQEYLTNRYSRRFHFARNQA